MDAGEEVTEEELAEFAEQVREAVGKTQKGWGSTTGRLGRVYSTHCG